MRKQSTRPASQPVVTRARPAVVEAAGASRAENAIGSTTIEPTGASVPRIDDVTAAGSRALRVTQHVRPGTSPSRIAVQQQDTSCQRCIVMQNSLDRGAQPTATIAAATRESAVSLNGCSSSPPQD